MLRMQINAGDYGGFGAVESACRIEHRPFTHCTPSPFTRAPIINNSCPCYVKPALESTSPQIPLILELLPAVQWTVLKSARVLRGPQSTAKALLHFLRISSHYQVYGNSLPLTTRV